MVKKYRKKPVVIEAVQLKKDYSVHVMSWCLCFCMNAKFDEENLGIIIPTLEGDHLARWDDWIIKGLNDELYPCKPDIFEKTYELVD